MCFLSTRMLYALKSSHVLVLCWYCLKLIYHPAQSKEAVVHCSLPAAMSPVTCTAQQRSCKSWCPYSTRLYHVLSPSLTTPLPCSLSPAAHAAACAELMEPCAAILCGGRPCGGCRGQPHHPVHRLGFRCVTWLVHVCDQVHSPALWARAMWLLRPGACNRSLEKLN